MKVPKINMLLAVLSALFLCGIVNAEEQKKPGGITFTGIALSTLPYEDIFYRNGKEFVKLELRNGRRSNPYSLSKAEALELFIKTTDPEKPYQLIAKAALVPNTRKMLYFIAETRSTNPGGLPLGLFGIDDSDSAFPDGSFRFINFFKVPLGIEFNKKRFIAQPGRSAVHRLNLPKEGAFTPFIVKDKKGKVLGGTRLFSHAANREMVLIFPPKKGKKRLDIRYFSD